MNYDIKKICNHIPKFIGEEKFFKAAVNILLIETEKGYEVLFQVRSTNIPDQPGDICLPGGSLEEGESPFDAAVREACEELLIEPNQIEIIGQSDIFYNYNILIYPFVGILHDYKFTYSSNEVAEVFTVPLDFLVNTEPDIYTVDSIITPGDDFPYHLIYGGKDYKWRKRKIDEYFYHYNGHEIWGMTARIINAFVGLLK